jgi:hypothetical protein
VLEGERALGQRVGDDHLHAALAEGAARLLVGEHGPERRHLRGQLGDVLLRAVDHRQPFVEFLQVGAGVLAGRRHRLVEVVRDRIEPLVDRARVLGLAARQQLTHRLDVGRGLRLQMRELGDLGGFGAGGLGIGPPQRTRCDHGQACERRKPREHDRNRSRQREKTVHRGHPITDSQHKNEK